MERSARCEGGREVQLGVGRFMLAECCVTTTPTRDRWLRPVAMVEVAVRGSGKGLDACFLFYVSVVRHLLPVQGVGCCRHTASLA